MLERYREGFGRVLHPLTTSLARAGVTPNVLSVVSLLFAFAAALALAFASGSRAVPLLAVAAALIGVNAILDVADGRLARLTGAESRRGDYLDHVIDRYADAAILLGLTFNPDVDWRWGVLALVGTFLTSYMGTQAQALGLPREYRGFLGRADRLILLIAIPMLEAGRLALGFALPLDATLLNLVLAWFAIAGNATAIQRFLLGWRDIKD